MLGTPKLNGDIAPLGHAWNAVVIDGKYSEIDATWAAGYVDKGKFTQEFKDLYFMVPPAEFIKTHIAFDPVWQFLDNPVSHKEFLADDFSKLKVHSTFNFSDSIKTFAGLDSLTALIRETRRISNSGLTNDLLRKHVYRNQQNIVQFKYNSAVSEFNKGVEAYNIYVMNKNKQFNGTSMEEEKILELLSSARIHSETAENRIKYLNAGNPTTLKNISTLQSTIGKLIQNIDSEDAFMKKYIKTWKPLRMFLFVR